MLQVRGTKISFFYNATKTEVAGRRVTKAKASVSKEIPIASLRSLGCSVCPRDKDTALESPKMKPSGTKKPLVYLLGTSPDKNDDEANLHWQGRMGDELYKQFGKGFMKESVRSNYIQQCMGDQSVVEIECCRSRIEADIEETKPKVIVGIGDAPLRWATGTDGNAMASRGEFIVVKIGKHVCFYYSLLYPNYLHAKGKRKTEYELTFAHDVRDLMLWILFDEKPTYYPAPYDTGIELITGQEPGDMERLERALIEMAREPRSAVDIETNGLRPYMLDPPHIWMAAVGTFKRTIAFAIDHPEGWGTEARKKRVMALLGRYLLESGRKAAHNLAFELEWFAYFFGERVLRLTEWDDTMAMAHTLDERAGTKSLDYQTRIRFGFWLKEQSRVDPVRILEYPIKEALRYNGLDTKWTDKLRDHYDPLIYQPQIPGYEWEYERKVRLAPTLALTEALGMPIDQAYAKKQADRLNESARSLELKIDRCPEVKEYRSRFGQFSPTNSDHVLKLLKEVCHRDEVRVVDHRTEVVSWTTSEDVISKIPAKEVPSVALILEHRGVAKLLSTYVAPIVSRKNVCHDGRIRSKYSSMIAVTGRLAAEDPAVQNWPARKHKEVRGMVAVEQARVERLQRMLLAADYGQIEFRVVGMASEDRNLIKACWTGYDVHKFWAQRMIAIYGPVKDWILDEFPEVSKAEDVDAAILKTLRQEAKNKWVFPQLFGSSIQSCAEQLHLPDWVANDLSEEFWDEFRDVKKWQEKLLISYEKNLYVETLSGRRRRGPMTKNEVINMPIQGTACDIVVTAMSSISERAFMEGNQELQPIFNGHDDLTYELFEANLDRNMPIVVEEMCRHRFDYINVPLVVELKAGHQWHKLQEIGVYRSDKVFHLPNPYQE